MKPLSARLLQLATTYWPMVIALCTAVYGVGVKIHSGRWIKGLDLGLTSNELKRSVTSEIPEGSVRNPTPLAVGPDGDLLIVGEHLRRIDAKGRTDFSFNFSY